MILWINGDWIMGQGVLCVRCNLVLGEVLWQGNDVDVVQVEQVCWVVCVVFLCWVWFLLVECQVVVECFVGLLESNKVELIVIIVREMGKSCWEVVIEVMVMINKIVILIKVYYVCIGEQCSEMLDGVVSL